MNYADFLRAKERIVEPVGFDPDDAKMPAQLFAFQRDIVRWATRLGRAALFCECGMGKTIMQLAWAQLIVERTRGAVLILAPLAVAKQTVHEAERFGVSARYLREDDGAPGIVVANYEMLPHFKATRFVGVVLDESSILKAYDGKTRTAIINEFATTPYKLACTATPAPNDFMELGNHSEFLGVMSRSEMLATFFVHDGGSTQDWRIKGHAQRAFWKWVSNWAAMLRRPSDLGYDDEGFQLPPLQRRDHIIAVDHTAAWKSGTLFAVEAKTLQERRAARRGTIEERVAKCVELIAAEPDEQWLVWCNLNDEGNALEKSIPGAVQIAGRHSSEEKERAMLAFVDGSVRVLVTKPSIAGFGLNLQGCARQVFVGLSDSFEEYYQAVRRCWRFGQRRAVDVHVIVAETERAILENIRRKERDAVFMGDEMSRFTREFVRAAVRGTRRDVIEYKPSVEIVWPAWMR